MKTRWNIRQQAKNPKTIEIDFYGDIEGDYYDWWDGWIESDTSAKHIKEELKAFGDFNRVELHINSMGGSVFEANAIANILRRLECETVAYIDAFACSAASVIAVACKKVVMPRNAVLMIHNPWQWACGNAAELRKAADDLDVLSEAFMTIYLDKAGDKLDEETLKQLLDAETYLTAEQATQYGLCDEIEQYDAVMKEPSASTKNAAAKQHIDINKICAMIRGDDLQANAEKRLEDNKIEEVKEKIPETKEEPEPDTFKTELSALIQNIINWR